MRKIVVGAFISLDGIMQAPGGPEEDPTGGFKFGGWIPPFWHEDIGKAVDATFSQPFDLLLGRRTYDIFAAHWPHFQTDPSASDFNALNAGIAEMFNRITKYVATHRPDSLTWQNSEALGPDVIETLRRLKQEDGPNLLTQGSTELLHLLFENDLVDELRLIIFPVMLGKGKRLFAGGTTPGSLHLTSSRVASNGVIIVNYERAGEVRSGSFGMETPTAEELERRRNLK